MNENETINPVSPETTSREKELARVLGKIETFHKRYDDEKDRLLSLPESPEISAQLNEILNKIDSNNTRIIELEDRLIEERGINLRNFLLFHKLIHSGIHGEHDKDTMKLDTPNHDIEKLIDELLQE